MATTRQFGKATRRQGQRRQPVEEFVTWQRFDGTPFDA